MEGLSNDRSCVCYGAGLRVKEAMYISFADIYSNRSVTQSLMICHHVQAALPVFILITSQRSQPVSYSTTAAHLLIHSLQSIFLRKLQHIPSNSAGIHNDTSSLHHNILVFITESSQTPPKNRLATPRPILAHTSSSPYTFKVFQYIQSPPAFLPSCTVIE